MPDCSAYSSGTRCNLSHASSCCLQGHRQSMHVVHAAGYNMTRCARMGLGRISWASSNGPSACIVGRTSCGHTSANSRAMGPPAQSMTRKLCLKPSHPGAAPNPECLPCSEHHQDTQTQTLSSNCGPRPKCWPQPKNPFSKLPAISSDLVALAIRRTPAHESFTGQQFASDMEAKTLHSPQGGAGCCGGEGDAGDDALRYLRLHPWAHHLAGW